ncbi:MAG: DinB family protein [Dehalococcoidia bacterium]|nr:DinB family protein [Dehalococcoidia bacterium]
MSSEHTMKDSRGGEVSLPEEQRQQVISYLKHQGSKPASDLLVLIQRGAKMLDDALAGVTEEQARISPAEGEWSISEVLRHVEASALGCAQLVRALARGEKGAGGFDGPSMSEGGSLRELRGRVAAAYEEIERAVAALDAADLETTANHPFFGEINCKEWAAFMYVHTRDHVTQIEATKQQAQTLRSQ